jgi:hypothetical protein
MRFSLKKNASCYSENNVYTVQVRRLHEEKLRDSQSPSTSIATMRKTKTMMDRPRSWTHKTANRILVEDTSFERGSLENRN